MIDFEKVKYELRQMQSELMAGINSMDDDEQFPCVVAMRLAIERIKNIRGELE